MVFAHRTKENGQERVEIEEDGVLKTVIINGKSSQTQTWKSNCLFFLHVFDLFSDQTLSDERPASRCLVNKLSCLSKEFSSQMSPLNFGKAPS